MYIHPVPPAGSVRTVMFVSYNRVHYSLQIFEDKLGNHEVGPQRDTDKASCIVNSPLGRWLPKMKLALNRASQ